MAERSFADEVEKLRLGAGATFHGEGILAVTKALLQAGVSYVGGYQGSPISHLMDVLSDAQGLLGELGVHFEASASEASAAAMLAASVNYPLRGAVTWKSTVGTNVASDALANLASGGVTGGAVIIVGEDYGEGSSIMQERSHAFAMKSQIWLVDPRPNLPSIVELVEKSFEFSEATNTPVMLELRVRSCHLYGSFTAKDNVRPDFTAAIAQNNPRRDVNRIVLPPASFQHEREKIAQRLPAALKFIRDHRLNEFLGGAAGEAGIIVQGGLYNTLMRALELLGLADSFGRTEIPIYVLNVTYPLVPDEVTGFCADKKAVLIVEEGQPDYLEQALNAMLRRADIQTRVIGKDVLPMAGEYTGQVMFDGCRAFLEAWAPQADRKRDALDSRADGAPAGRDPSARAGDSAAAAGLLHRLSGATAVHGDEAGRARDRRVPRLVRHRLSSVLDPAAVQHRRDHYGLWPGRGGGGGVLGQRRAARGRGDGRRRLLAQRADLRRRQRGVQQLRQCADHCRQRLCGGHRRPGPAVFAPGQQDQEHQPSDHPGGARCGCDLGAPDRPDVRPAAHEGHAEGGDDDAGHRVQRSLWPRRSAC